MSEVDMPEDIATIRDLLLKGEKEMSEVDMPEDIATIRDLLLELISKLRGEEGKPKSLEVALAVTKIQEACFWLGETEA